MSNTKRFRDQHVELQKLVGDISKYLITSDSVINGAGEIRSLLSQLMGKLTMHLSAEDKILYPSLIKNSDSKVSAMATKFSKEMESTAKVVVGYNQKWSTPLSIKSNPQEFIRETKNIFNALADRINRENTQLYVAADAVKM